jgi:opacity protein-like surface antigen
VLGILPVSERFEAYARAGLLWASQEVELTPNSSIFTDAGEQWVLGVGVQAELSRGWSARLEYQRVDKMPGTFMSGDVEYERVLAGATYRLGSRAAPATDREAPVQTTQGGFYAVADVGVSEPTVGRSDGFLIAIVPFPGFIFHVSPASVSASGSEPGYGATLGYRINRYLAAELTYADFGSIDITEEYLIELPFPFPRDEPRRETINLTAQVTGPSINLLGKLPVGGDFELFFRGGVLFADQDVTRWNGDFTSTSSNAEELWVIGGGVDVRIADRWSARVAYESVDRMRKGRSVGPIRLERFVFGVSYDF